MKWKNIFTIYGKELRDALRDRRTLMSTIVLPTFIMPVLMLGVGKIGTSVITKAYEETPVVVLLGGKDSPGIVAQLRQSPRVRVIDAPENWKDQIAEKKIRAAIELPVGFEAALQTASAPTIKIYYYEGEMKSSIGADGLERFLRELRDKTVADRLTEKSLPAAFARPFEYKRENVAPAQKVGGNRVGGFVPYAIILFCLLGASVPATDLTAGEKERGTMETLLCSPVARLDIVLGKFLVVLTGSLCAMGFMLLSMAGTAVAAGLMVSGPRKAAVVAAQAQSAASMLPSIDPMGILGVLAMVLPVAMMFSALTLTIGVFAKSAKEAQSYLAPLMMLVLLPAIVGILPGIELNARLSFVPLLNLSLVCKEMLSGIWHWNYIALIFSSSCCYAALALGLAVKMFNRESVIFRT